MPDSWPGMSDLRGWEMLAHQPPHAFVSPVASSTLATPAQLAEPEVEDRFTELL